MVSIKDGNSMRSLGDWSDRSSSSVEDPPLFHVIWSIVVHSDVVSIASKMLSKLESFSNRCLLSDSELDVVTEWLSSISVDDLINPPVVKMVVSVNTGSEENILSVSVGVWFHAVSTKTSDLSLHST